MDEVFITNVQTSDSAGGGIANEFISLNFSKIKMTYKMQADTGGDEASPEVTIDVKQNVGYVTASRFAVSSDPGGGRLENVGRPGVAPATTGSVTNAKLSVRVDGDAG